MKRDPLENSIEEKFVEHVESCTCLCLKLNPLGVVGIPDRLVLGPKMFILFVELKRLNKKPRPIQVWFHNKLREFGFAVMVPDNIEDAIEGFNSHFIVHMKKGE